jgi:hypothetical protein
LARAGALKGKKAIQIEQAIATVTGPPIFAAAPPPPKAGAANAATPATGTAPAKKR